jgi:N-acetylglucosamine kinase-like BadF-type ATPase
MTSVAVDGGQSALRLRVLPDGRCGRGPGYTHGDDAVQATVTAVQCAADEAGLDHAPVEVAALGLTGCPSDPALVRALAAGVADVLDAAEVRICADMVTAHAGALPDGYGVVVAAGTGVVCLAVDVDGSWHKVDGHGYLFGDTGSAFAIGRAGLVAMQRARDGRGPATALAAVDLEPVTLYSSATLVDDVARFAPTVLRCDAAGDPVARCIVDQAASDLAETITTGVASLAGNGTVPVACVGGLFAAGEQLLGPLRERLGKRADLVAATGTALDGAARLATGSLEPYSDLITVFRRL